ncbi:UPF0262 family protein [Oharaeibacter diazotrophicus]|uniref:UPF0262 protein EDD54_2096 n=1 Tax=Oharaeibacter diazotrophicus TaxID=1920512 RepID=A0A4R6RHE2_9HYPH|nr:UPF0262 family protein [Oharaeibacter diazotrophicus]TDP85247.1 uncharacterized protein (UPF0262 family) [Oharaeibacter diazotrophicus]BBE74217.1 hypothetical protein OHA_1_03846 [Pleomorphomonas sp. SM30]GLS76095.1 UPF0262 protein [Oharaeibacter diazotrophicus]
MVDLTARRNRGRLVAVDLDEASIGRSSSEVEHERRVAIYDLIEENTFEPAGRDEREFRLRLSIVDRKLVLEVTTPDGGPVVTHVLSLTPFRRVVKDYFMICDSYYQAIRTASPSQIEAIDMGRRGLHNEGARLLIERLDGKVSVDVDTARRLFTLLSVLHWKG